MKIYSNIILLGLSVVAFSLAETAHASELGSKNINQTIHMVSSGNDLIETVIEVPSEGNDIKGMVVFIRGSGSGDMREYFPGFIDTYLRDVFLKEGYAIILLNKRGVGKSTGNWKRSSSFRLMAEDVIRIVDYYSEIKPHLGRKVGVVGHSQGGWVVQRIAGMNSNVDFAISLVGPVTTLAEQDLKRHRNFLECDGLEGRQLEKGMNKRLRTHNMWRKLGGWFPYFELGFMHNIVDDSTSDDLKKSTIPMLLAYGGSDGLVSLHDNQQRLKEIFPTGLPENIHLLLDPVADHYLTVHNRLCNDYETISERDFSPKMYDGYIAWLNAQVFD